MQKIEEADVVGEEGGGVDGGGGTAPLVLLLQIGARLVVGNKSDVGGSYHNTLCVAEQWIGPGTMSPQVE